MLGREIRAFTKDQISKIGNTVIYLSNHVPDLNKTKILKLLFIIEEAAIKKTGKPFFGIDFQLWKYGPVPKDIYIDLTTSIWDDSPILLNSYIQRNPDSQENYIARAEFNDDEFSDHDIQLLDLIVSFAKDKTANYLVQHTHGTNSLWRKSAIKYGVLELLENELLNSTDHTVDFGLLFDENSPLSERYEEFKENRDFNRQLKR